MLQFSVPKRGVSPCDWHPTVLFSKLSKDVALSRNLPSTVDLQRQEIKKNNMLYNMLENKRGNALLLRRDVEKKNRRGQGCAALVIHCGSQTVQLGRPGLGF